MTIEKRSVTSQGSIGTGPYLAKVVGHLDTTVMGGLEVTLLRTEGNVIGESTQTYPVKYASPFFGNTAFEFMGLNPTDYNDTQKSYGMWFVPPDVGNTVLVVFVDGRADAGFWIGCVPGRFINNMVPGIAASSFVAYENGKKEEYDVDRIPVAEINRRANDLGAALQIDKIPKPVHPFADRLLEQGLLEDQIRGITSSSSRRGIPSTVFGISTPGPLDRRSTGKKSFIGKSDSPTRIPVPVSRMGGSQIVFDDGDDRFQRKTLASLGPPDYVDLTTGAKGEPNVPKDEHIRIRTRTGHQILLHNSEDLIYIGNSKGTAWIELTSDGKIDIFAEDSISVHTKQDFNFYADRDINLEAGRNINMKAALGRLRQECATDLEVLVGNDGKITIGNNYEHVIGNDTKITTTGNLDLNTAGHNKFTAGTTTDLKSAETNYFEAGDDTNIKSGGRHYETASRIDMNGPPASAATEAATARPITALPTHPNISIETVEGWKNRYQEENPLNSIMKRIPMHEPWPMHENLMPLSVKPDLTDREE
jgi:hypothetical protein